MYNFALIGAAGFVAPRHMRAIKETGNTLLAALDPSDTVGILDSYFPDAKFFTEFERFDRYVELSRREARPIEFVSITSPNYLHDSHVRFALRSGASAICEKPLVINPWNIDGLKLVESEQPGRVYTILQLRLHESIIAIRNRVLAALASQPSRRWAVDLTYITSRGSWYHSSWKGDDRKSGGVTANIGIHFFDMLAWIFGEPGETRTDLLQDSVASGTISLAHADVRWFLSIDQAHLPSAIRAKGQRTFRNITIDREEIEFSEGFTDLHTASYRDIVAGGGFGLDDARPSIELVHRIRTEQAAGPSEDCHPFVQQVLRE